MQKMVWSVIYVILESLIFILGLKLFEIDPH